MIELIAKCVILDRVVECQNSRQHIDQFGVGREHAKWRFVVLVGESEPRPVTTVVGAKHNK